MKIKAAAILLVFAAIFVPSVFAAASDALALIYEAGRAEEPAEKAALYRRAIDEGGKTQLAAEALWRLSQLYVHDFDEPDMKNAGACLEEFCAKFSDSEWLSNVEMTLFGYYEGEKNWKKYVALGEKILADKSIPKKYRDEIAARIAAAKKQI